MKLYPIPMVPGPVKVAPRVLDAYQINYGSGDLEAEFVEFIDDPKFWQNRKYYLTDLLDTSGSIVRHDSQKLARLLQEIIST